MDNRTRKLLIYAISPLVFVTLIVWLAVLEHRPDFLMKVSFLDVGQGDAVFIETYQGTQILVDGGPSGRVLSELGQQMPFFDRSIDLLILSHADADHVTGLVEVLKRFEVKKVLISGVVSQSAVYREFERLLRQKNVEVIVARQGQRVWLDNATVFDVYWPEAGSGLDSLAINDASIFGKLIFGKTKILLTGDVASRIEDVLLPRFNLDADILKVGHHGSKSSTSVQLLEEVTPEFSVIQVGKNNSYGHPAPQVLDNLSSSSTTILRNDLDGQINFTSDGTSFKLIK
jgi:competence protein ComEC